MITLHYHPSNASFSPHILLHELGVPFRLQRVDRAQGEHKSAAYLKLNPNGLIPVLVDGELVLYETAAICLHLADTHPAAALAPAPGSVERAHMYKWLVWMSNTMQAMLMHYFYSERMVDADNAEGARQVKQHAQRRVVQCLEQLDAHLGGHTNAHMNADMNAHKSAHTGGQIDAQSDAQSDWHAGAQSQADRGPWMMGHAYTLLDPYALMLCRWTRGFSTFPARSFPHLGPYLQRVLARPAVQRAIATEELGAPLV